MGEKNKVVVVLGSGESLGKLTKEEIAYINNCEVVIALNLYIVFYKKLGVVPTHIFEIEFIYENDPVIRMMIDIIKEDRLKNITFVLREYSADFIVKTKNAFFKKQVDYKIEQVKKLLSFKRSPFKFVRDFFSQRKILIIPKGCNAEFVSRNNYDYIEYDGTWSWASSLQEPLFQIKSSLTAALNYVSIKYKGYSVYLAGTDLNSGKYYYQEELEASKIKQVMDNVIAKDSRTANQVKLAEKNNTYFPALEFNGYSVFDAFPFILENLKKSDNRIFCVNSESALVTKGVVPFSKLP